jgi:hypothetical protein
MVGPATFKAVSGQAADYRITSQLSQLILITSLQPDSLSALRFCSRVEMVKILLAANFAACSDI